MDKEMENIVFEKLRSLFKHRKCPNCGSTQFIYETNEYKYVGFSSLAFGALEFNITGDNFHWDTKQEKISCVYCDWEEEY